MEQKKGLSSFWLHILAMAFMLCDHLWATFFPYLSWLTCIGRIAYPIFAFMIVEGYFHTSNVKKYILRLLAFAVISEIPFNLIYGSSVIYPFHQNVLWTFLISIMLIVLFERVKRKEKLWLTILVGAAIILIGFVVGTVTFVDFYGYGVLMVLCFYFFRGRKWWCYLGQLAGMFYINYVLMGGYCFIVTVFGRELSIPQQSFALLALIPIWLYNGNGGYNAKWFKYFCYAFYPVHLLLLYLIWSQV